MLAFYLSLVSDDGDKTKIELIYTEHREYMLYRAAQKLTNASEVEDALHEAMLRIIKVIRNVDVSDAEMLKCFCGRVAENTALDLNRRSGNNSKNVPYFDSTSDQYKNDDIPEQILYARGALDIIYKAIKSMNTTYRDVCFLKFVESLSDEDIAVLLGMNKKTVSVYASRGRKIIKEALRKEGFHE